tara:strand:- start:6669 stop:7343 length:675 start_codon:yes stop_codon:yes gene_type:complete
VKTLLSTKKLPLAQKELCLNAGISLVEYDAISIEFLPFSTPKSIENAIFTSKNGVLSVFSAKNINPPNIKNCYCVGQQTAELLEKKGQKVLEIGGNASDLGQILIKKHQNRSFHYFCSEQRREELPSLLKSAQISCQEIVSYRTVLKPRKFERQFDVVAFFSPTGVRSFTTYNTLVDATACCIGPTTASEAQKHTDTIVIANTPSIASTLTQAIKLITHDRTNQ